MYLVHSTEPPTATIPAEREVAPVSARTLPGQTGVYPAVQEPGLYLA